MEGLKSPKLGTIPTSWVWNSDFKTPYNPASTFLRAECPSLLMILLGTFRYWDKLSSSVQYYLKLPNIVKYCPVLFNIVQVTISAHSCRHNEHSYIVQYCQELTNFDEYCPILSAIDQCCPVVPYVYIFQVITQLFQFWLGWPNQWVDQF